MCDMYGFPTLSKKHTMSSTQSHPLRISHNNNPQTPKEINHSSYSTSLSEHPMKSHLKLNYNPYASTTHIQYPLKKSVKK